MNFKKMSRITAINKAHGKIFTMSQLEELLEYCQYPLGEEEKEDMKANRNIISLVYENEAQFQMIFILLERINEAEYKVLSIDFA